MLQTPIPRQKPTLFIVNSICRDICLYLKHYLQECKEKTKPIDKRGFIDFLKDKYSTSFSGFLDEKPFAPYTSDVDFGVSLYFPDRLESETKVLIGHTTFIHYFKGDFGFVFFLQGDDVEIEIYTKEKFINVVGEEKIHGLKPDFYFWLNQHKYLVDKMKEKEKDINSVNLKIKGI